MRRLSLLALIAAGLMVFEPGAAVSAQEGKDQSGKQSSGSGLTGTGAGGETTVATTGRADGQGNPLLGGESRPLYRLKPSDVAEVSFTVAPEFNQTLTVQPDGYVSLKDAGSIHAEGMTLAEFAQAVEQSYHGYLHDPQAAVALKEFEHPFFIVGGEVGRPGKYELRSDTTVAEGVEIAGGLTSQARHSQVVLFRRVNNELVETRVLNLKKMLRGASLGEDAHLRAGDMVFVPQNAISKIARFMTRPSMSMYVSSSQF
jgi:polysaccharide export outer membrane protein